MEVLRLVRRELVFVIASILITSSLVGNQIQLSFVSSENSREFIQADDNSPKLHWSAVWDRNGTHEEAYDIATDSVGFLYAVGSVDGDVVLLKYNQDGEMIWETIWDGGGTEWAKKIKISASNDIYVTGDTDCSGSMDALLLKFSTLGALEWNITWGGVDHDTGEGITIDESGLVYICGTTNGDWGDMYATKFDTNGVELWSATWGEYSQQIAYDIAIDDGYIYLAGEHYSGSSGYEDFELVKLNASGGEEWNVEWGGFGTDIAYEVEIGNDSNIYVAGYTTSDGPETSNVMLRKYNPDGDELWNTYWAQETHQRPRGMIIDSASNMYVTGYTLGLSFVLKVDTAGDITWSTTLDQSAHGICRIDNGNLFVVGTNFRFGTTQFINIVMLGPESVVDSKALDEVWTYSSEGLIEVAGTADITGDGSEEVVCISREGISSWIEVVDNGVVLWNYSCNPNAYDHRVIPANLDSDSNSELLVYTNYMVSMHIVDNITIVDDDGTKLWTRNCYDTWSTQFQTIDMNSDNVDEIAIVINGSLYLWNSDGAEIWKIDGNSTKRLEIQTSGDYNGDGRNELVVSRNDYSDYLNSSCMIVDFYGNIIVNFPIFSIRYSHENRGKPIQIAMANFYDDAELGFYYVTEVGYQLLSFYLVDSTGRQTTWYVPYDYSIDASFYYDAKAIIADFDTDGKHEILFRGEAAMYMMNSYGRVLWCTNESSIGLLNSYRWPSESLFDINGDSVDELIVLINNVLYSYDPISGHLLEKYILEGETGLLADLDLNDVSEIITQDESTIRVYSALSATTSGTTETITTGTSPITSSTTSTSESQTTTPEIGGTLTLLITVVSIGVIVIIVVIVVLQKRR